MIRRFLPVAFLLAFLAVASGCRTAPVYNVSNAPIPAGAGGVSMDDMKSAIVGAGAGLGWQMKAVEPGKVLGTLNLRSHMAQVSITYNTETYNIRYQNSANLKYNGETIHQNYNGWVQRLDGAIQSRLASM